MARNLEFLRPRSLMRFEPFRELRRFERKMDRMQEELSHYLLSIDLPGVAKEDIKGELQDNPS